MSKMLASIMAALWHNGAGASMAMENISCGFNGNINGLS